MITNIGKLIWKLMLAGNSRNSGVAQVETTDGNNVYIYYPAGAIPTLSGFANSNRTPGVAIGSGTTPPTVNDTRLESQITSGVSVSITATADVDASGNPYQQALVRITNTGSDSITIAEIGWQLLAYGHTNATYSAAKTNCFFLMDRTLLNTPVTIPVGETTIITYRVTIDLA